jgi:caffeoyl-CoA O-methyltransferase
MPGILNPQVEKYLDSCLPKRDPLLAEMEQYAKKHSVPIIGPACGRLLYQLTQISGAKRIFEMGSAIGYTALWFARAAGPEGEVFFTDSDPANIARAKDYLARAGVAHQIKFLQGEAVGLIDTVPGEFDIILIDVFKHQYPAALEKSLPRLKHGGLVITDNVLWSGKVARAAKASDKDTRAIQKFNKMIFSSAELFPVIVPLRDGVAVCRKS